MISIPVFDGHNDVLKRLYKNRDADPIVSFLDGGLDGHIDLPKARAGNLVGGLFAIFCPSPKNAESLGTARKAFDFNAPMPPPLPIELARDITTTQIALLMRLIAASEGAMALCCTGDEIEAAIKSGALAAVLHAEGLEAVDEDLYFLDLLYAAGLRSLGPVWSRNNQFGYGVHRRFPGSPDQGEGLTPAGRRLVAACNRLGIVIDLSHINEKGFWDVAELTDAPLVATHSNVHSICASPRNLTARQLSAIRDSDGLVGLNFATGFLRSDGLMESDTEIDWMLRHLDSLLEALGETRVGLGSDFDGAVVPAAIGSAAGLPVLIEAMRRHGYGEPLIEAIAWRNWVSLLRRVIG